MKKNLMMLSILMAVICVSACKNNQTKETSDEVVVDTAAIVKEQLATVEEVFAMTDAFQEGTKALKPTGDVWDEVKKQCEDVLGKKGYQVELKTETGFFIAAKKNAQGVGGEEIAPYCESVEAVAKDSLSGVVCFTAEGDMYVSGTIYVVDDNVYRVLVEQLKEAGFNPDQERTDAEDPAGTVVLSKDFYWVACNPQAHSIKFNYDFMGAQGF